MLPRSSSRLDATPTDTLDAKPTDTAPTLDTLNDEAAASDERPEAASPDATVDAADALDDAPADLAVDESAADVDDEPGDALADAAPDAPPDATDTAPDDAPDDSFTFDVDCPVGYERCGGMCVDLSGDRNNCGRCGSACTSRETCIGGSCGCGINQRTCAGACVSVLSDNANCGACGNACALPETCFAGTCSCPPGRIVCGTGCVDPQADNAHCGRCDNACGEGACAAGVCGCAGGRRWCAGRCVDAAADVANCGACGNACVAPAGGGVASCTAGACRTTLTCAAGTANCNGNDADGCEIATTASLQHCGGCGRACASAQRCAAGACATARSCAEIHALWPALPSGLYDILPDGAAMTRVGCDMETSGGGWTIVYLGPSGATNLASSTLPYDVDIAALRTATTEVLLAYRNGSRQVTDASWARFVMPADWIAQSPFRYETRDVPVSASIGGAAAATVTLKYGWREFGNDCGSDWVRSQLSGRVCLTGTAAPFFNGFSTTRYVDRCPNSNRRWDDAYCTDSRRFSIAVR